MKVNPIGWFEIYVDDMARAAKFYETVFETKTEAMASGPEIQMQAFAGDMTSHGSGGVLAHMPGFKAGGNSVLIYFKSDDCAIEEKRIAAAGGKVFKPKMNIGPYGFITLGIDTEGNMFGIHSMK